MQTINMQGAFGEEVSTLQRVIVGLKGLKAEKNASNGCRCVVPLRACRSALSLRELLCRGSGRETRRRVQHTCVGTKHDNVESRMSGLTSSPSSNPVTPRPSTSSVYPSRSLGAAVGRQRELAEGTVRISDPSLYPRLSFHLFPQRST